MASVEPNRLYIEDNKWVGIEQPDAGIFRFEARAALLRSRIDRFITYPFIESSIIHAGLTEEYEIFSNLSREIRGQITHPFFELMALQLINIMIARITNEKMFSQKSATLLEMINRALPIFLSAELDEANFKMHAMNYPDLVCRLLSGSVNVSSALDDTEQACHLIEWLSNTGPLRNLVRFPELGTYPAKLAAIVDSAHIYPTLDGWRLSFKISSQQGNTVEAQVKTIDFHPFDLENLHRALEKQFHSKSKARSLLAREATPIFEIDFQSLWDEYYAHTFPIGYVAAWYLCMDIHKHRHAYLADEHAIRQSEALWFLFLCRFQGAVLKDEASVTQQAKIFLSKTREEDREQKNAESLTQKVSTSPLPFFALPKLVVTRSPEIQPRKAVDAEISNLSIK
jgi:hypothetical protein